MTVEFHDQQGRIFHQEFQKWRRLHPRGYFLTFSAKQRAQLHTTLCWHSGTSDWTYTWDLNGTVRTGRTVSWGGWASDGQQVVTRDVQRCTNVSSGRPEYWDVTYNFRGAEHRVQMTAPPGPTILVNRQGEPRV